MLCSPQLAKARVLASLYEFKFNIAITVNRCKNQTEDSDSEELDVCIRWGAAVVIIEGHKDIVGARHGDDGVGRGLEQEDGDPREQVSGYWSEGGVQVGIFAT